MQERTIEEKRIIIKSKIFYIFVEKMKDDLFLFSQTQDRPITVDQVLLQENVAALDQGKRFFALKIFQYYFFDISYRRNFFVNQIILVE